MEGSERIEKTQTPGKEKKERKKIKNNLASKDSAREVEDNLPSPEEEMSLQCVAQADVAWGTVLFVGLAETRDPSWRQTYMASATMRQEHHHVSFALVTM